MIKTASVKYGASSLLVRYMYSPDVLALASESGIDLRKLTLTKRFDASQVSFVCDHIIVGWSNIKDPSGNDVEFDSSLLPLVFESAPTVFESVIFVASRLSRFGK